MNFSPYAVCPDKPSRPRIHIAICMAKCDKVDDCLGFYLRKRAFEDMINDIRRDNRSSVEEEAEGGN
jgi:hypothetical protein